MKQQPIYIRHMGNRTLLGADMRTEDGFEDLSKTERERFARYDHIQRCDTCAKFLRYFQGNGACGMHYTAELVPLTRRVDDFCSDHEAR